MLASLSRGLINFNWDKMSSVIENLFMSVDVNFMDHVTSKEKYTIQIHILA